MSNTICEALMYEKQGLINEALLIYKNILRRDPNNAVAKKNLDNLSAQHSSHAMLGHFLRLNDDDIQKLKKWLVSL